MIRSEHIGRGERLARLVLSGGSAVLIALILLPLIWAVLQSFAADTGFFKGSFNGDGHWTLENYRQILEADKIPAWAQETGFVAGVSAVISVMLCLPILCFSRRLETPTVQNGVRLFAIMGWVLPPLFLALVSRYATSTSHWLEPNALLIVYPLIQLPAVFLLLQAHKCSSEGSNLRDLQDALILDNSGFWIEVRHAILPTSGIVLAMAFIIAFFVASSDYAFALIFRGPGQLTLSTGIQTLMTGDDVRYGQVLAAATLTLAMMSSVFAVLLVVSRRRFAQTEEVS